MQQSKTFITSVLAVIAIVLIGGVAFFMKNGSLSTDTGNTGTPAAGGTTGTTDSAGGTGTTDTNPTPTTPVSSRYKDGTYTAVGNYVSPGGRQAITVTVTLKDDIITDMSATSGAIDEDSQKFERRFIGGVKTLVVGKSIDALNVSVVSGSSLTAGGFNDAIAKIKTQAQA